MEYVKLILQFLTSFFQNSTQKKKEEVKLADATEIAVVEKIRATENAQAVKQHAKVEDALVEIREIHKEERAKAKIKPNDDEQFGSEW
jgi:hypothetical protein